MKVERMVPNTMFITKKNALSFLVVALKAIHPSPFLSVAPKFFSDFSSDVRLAQPGTAEAQATPRDIQPKEGHVNRRSTRDRRAPAALIDFVAF
ncbi:hypothetical protein V6N13_061139 [Hibiscus sabdariffa]